MTEHKVVDGTDLILSVGGSEKYVKSFSESISADGFVIADGYNTYAELKKLQLKGEPVDASYGGRDNVGPSGSGKYIITSLELDAQAGDDSKYSIQLENTGKVGDTTKPGTVGG